MRVLAFDPGAIRCGWAVLDQTEDGPKEVASGILGLERGHNGSKQEEFQVYRLRLIPFFLSEMRVLIYEHQPDKVVNEIVPPVGGNIANSIQRQLATTAITTVQVVAFQSDIPVEQVGATTVKKNIGGTGKATKVAVRNGVYKLLPETKAKYGKEWVKVFDRCDSFAVGLTALVYKVEKATH